MSERIQKLIKPSIFLAAIVFVVCWFVKKPQEIGDYTTYLGYSVTAVTLCFLAYEKWLWRKIPWNRPPVLKAKYTGTIRYNYNGVSGEKTFVFRLSNHGLELIFRLQRILIPA